MMDILKQLFLWVLYSSISAGIVAFIFILVRMIFKNKIAPRIFCMLWLLVLIKLIITPFAPESLVSVFNIFNYNPVSSYVQDGVANFHPFTNPSYLRVSDKNEQLNSASKHSDETVRKNINTYSISKSANDGELTTNLDLVSVLALVWATGLLLMTCILIYSGIVFTRGLKNAERIPDALLPALLQDYNRKQYIKRNLAFYRSSGITSPCVAGVVKPRIFLPRQALELSDQQLTHILLHEIAHLIRRDYLINLLISAVNVVHWFNPVLWYAMKLFNMDREVSCDTYALEILGQEETISYGTTLLQLSKVIRKKRLQFNSSGFLKSEKQLERRIMMIKKFKEGSYRISIATLIFCLFIGMTTLTNAVGINTTRAAQKDQIRTALGNSSYKYFNSLKRALKFTNFTFKVPDYLPSGFGLYSSYFYDEKNANRNILVLQYWSTTNGGKMVSGQEEHHFSLSVSKTNLLQTIKSVKGAKYDENKMTINGLNVTSVVVHSKQKTNSKNIIILDTVKHLVWNDRGVWYNLEYYVATTGKNGSQNIMDNIPQNELTKILASMKDPKDIKNVNYTSSLFKNSFAIYDEEDLKDAKKLLGFTPKFPLSIINDCNISSAHIGSGIYFKNDLATPTLATNYSTTSKGRTLETVGIEQSKLSSLYDSIVKNGYMDFWNSTTRKNEKVRGKATNIAGINAFTFDISFTHEKAYVWQQNGVYYVATLSKDISDPDTVINTYITQNS